MKRILATVIVSLLITSMFSAVSVWAQGPPDIQQKIFIHYAKPHDRRPSPGGGDSGYYKLIGSKWKSFPVSLEVNPSGSGFSETSVLLAIQVAAEEWDDGMYSGWGGVPPNLFDNTISTTNKGYNDLAWTSGNMDGKNTIVWGNYPTSGVIAVTILWYNRATKTMIEFDMVLDTDYAWSTSGEAGKMDLQNIVTHELGHGAGLNDLYQSAAFLETMYGYSSLGDTIKRDLYTGDIQGITKLYG